MVGTLRGGVRAASSGAIRVPLYSRRDGAPRRPCHIGDQSHGTVRLAAQSRTSSMRSAMTTDKG
ncbi:MAG TPA: hypothetical protein VGV18_10270, partial [Verrucomicrobiae bacterium]|nr:hypothetical protein [Verrucomicrobiae bacterium]